LNLIIKPNPILLVLVVEPDPKELDLKLWCKIFFKSIFYLKIVQIFVFIFNNNTSKLLEKYINIMLFQDKYTFKIQKQTTFKANMRENVIEFSIYELHPRAMPRVNYCLHFKKSQDLKVLGFFAKLYPSVLGLVATPDPRVIFIILIITLNLG